MDELRMALMIPERLNPTGIQLRMAGTADEPLFCLNDVCQVLGIANARNVAERLDPDEKGVCLADTPGGAQEMTYVTEAGLYTVLLRSDKPAAKPFRQWVTREVIPCIRKHGCYPAPAPTSHDSCDTITVDLEVQTALVPVAEFRELMGALRRLERRNASNDLVDRVPGVVEVRQYVRELWPNCPDRTAQNIVRRLDQLYRDECGRPAPKLGYAPSAPLACEYEHMRLLFRAVSHFWREAHPDLGPDSLPFDQVVS